jgi:hypothetical protein
MEIPRKARQNCCMNIVPGMHGGPLLHKYVSGNTGKERSVAAFFLYGHTKNRKWGGKKKKKEEEEEKKKKQEEVFQGF